MQNLAYRALIEDLSYYEGLTETWGLLRYIIKYKKRPWYKYQRRLLCFKMIHSPKQAYCIILECSSQAELLFLLAVIFMPIFKKGRIQYGKIEH